MAGTNLAIISGNLGADPDIRALNSGERVATLRVATSQKWRDKSSGELREATEWHQVVVYGQSVDAIEQYLGKGDKVLVQGRIQTRKWTDKNGNDRYSTEIIASHVEFLVTKGRQGEAEPERPQARAQQKPQARTQPNFDEDEGEPTGDDAPF